MQKKIIPKYEVRLVPISEKGRTLGQYFGRTIYSDETVKKAFELRKQGITYAKIAQMLDVKSVSNISHWIKGIRRIKPVRYAKRKVLIRD